MRKILLMAFLAAGMAAHAEMLGTNEMASERENKGGVNLGQGADENDHWTMHAMVGVNVPMGAPDGVSFAPFRSWEFNLTVLQYDYTPKNLKTTFSVGLGVDWRTYTLKGHDKAFAKLFDYVAVGDAEIAGEKLKSNIRTTALSMPLLVKQTFSKNFAVSVGAQLNWNFYGRVHNYYKQGDDEVDIYTKNIGQRPFTVDVLGIVHVWELGVYCKYSPMSVLKKNRGVEFQSLAFGVYF
jgi:hypothetical protein